MTNATPAQPSPQPQDELAQIRAILADVAQRQQTNQIQIDRNTAALAETRALVESNARAIEVNSQSISTLRNDIQAGFAETRAEIQANVDDLVSMITTTSESVDSLSDSVQNLINDARADRVESQRRHAVNDKEHTAFREQFRSLLLEIRQIWQRLSA